MTTPLRIGIIGCGFMGRTHSNAWMQVAILPPPHQPVLTACCASPEEEGETGKFATVGLRVDPVGLGKLWPGNDVDLIYVCLPNVMHYDVVLAAAEAGKMVVCEKPLAMSAAEAEEMVAAVEKAGVANMSPSIIAAPPFRWHSRSSGRNASAARSTIGRPTIRITPFRPTFPGRMALWRLDAKVAGSGVTGDLLAHSIDTAQWLNGPIRAGDGPYRNFVSHAATPTRQIRAGHHRRRLHVLAIFANGSQGTFEIPATPAAVRTTTPSARRRNGAPLLRPGRPAHPPVLQATPIPRRKRRSRITSPAGSGST